MDIIAFVAGLIVGIVAVSVAVEFAWKKSVPEKSWKTARGWRLSEIRSPLIAAEKLLVAPPENAKVVVGSPSSFAKNARENPDVTGNFAVGVDRAFVFAGDIKEGQLAFVTSDEDIIQELRDMFFDFYTTRERATSHVAPKGFVTIRGRVKAVFPYHDGYLMRVSYEGGIVGVRIKDRMDVEGRRVEVEGKLLEPPFMEPHNITVLD
jgi:hypothetical protein